MTGDIEAATAKSIESASPGQRSPGAQATRTILKSIAVSVPVAVAFFVGLVALSVHNEQPDWNAWLGMAAGIGIIAGTFFGLLAGFVFSSHLFDA